MSASNTPLDLAATVAANRITPEAERWLAEGIAAWLRGGGELNLGRCLKLPATTAATNRARRDAALIRCAEHVDGAGPWPKSVRLLEELLRFESRLWPNWRHRYQDLPPDPEKTSRLNAELFEVFRAGAEIPRTIPGIYKIVRRAY